ncbi:AcrB/AcrD/AcrF family protein, partial [Clostridium perfringens]
PGGGGADASAGAGAPTAGTGQQPSQQPSGNAAWAGQQGAPGAGAAAGGPSGAPAVPTGIPTVKLSEIAKIEVIGTSESISRTNGKESIGIQIVKANDANTVDVVNQVKDKAEELRGLYPAMDLTIMLDQGKPSEDSVHTMRS